MYNEDEKKPYRTIKIQKRSTVSAPADITVVNADISGVNATFEGAMKALARCTKQVRDAIQKAGIPREDLRSSQLSIEQNYREEKIGEDKHGNDKFRRVPDGFLYRQNIKFEFPNDNDKLSAAIENIMATDVEPKVVFYFKSSSEEEMKNKALAKATADARREAEIVMEAAGTRLGKLIHAQVGEPSFDHGFRNEVMYERKAMDCAKIEFDPEDIDFEEGITLEWEIEG